MSLRLTIALAIILLVLGGFVYFTQRDRSEPAERDERPFIYHVNPDGIVGINVKYQDDEVGFVLTEEGWVFDDAEGAPVDMQRFGGMTYLLSGPKADRTLEAPVDLALYGLDEPQGTVTIVHRNMQPIVLDLGVLNTDRTQRFIRLQGVSDVYLVHSSWTQVLTRLATEPPHIPSAPEEAPTLP